MHIGIVGSGNVGGALGLRWASEGHQIAFGTRNADAKDMRELISQGGPGTRAVSSAEAVASSEVVLLATPWPATRQIVESIPSWSGKVVIDATNPLLPDLSGLAVGTTSSGAEQIADWAKGAKIVKAFNTVGANVMANPSFAPHPPAMFYCGDDKEAKSTVRQLIAQIGFDPHDAGPLRQARLLEPLAGLWVSLAFGGYGREMAFALMRR